MNKIKKDDVMPPEPLEVATTGYYGPFTLKFLYKVSLQCEENGRENGEISFEIYRFHQYPDPARFFYALNDFKHKDEGQRFCGPFPTERMAAAASAEEWLKDQLELRGAAFDLAESRRPGAAM